MLPRRYRELLWRVNLPHVSTNLFHRLQVTARKRPMLLADLHFDVVVAIYEQPLPESASVFK